MSTTTELETTSGTRIVPTDPIFGEILMFLTDEADLLDDDSYMQWLELITDDISYDMPNRRSVYRRDGDGFQETRGGYYGDNKSTLSMRARHNSDIESAWFREPPTRAHRIVSNVIARTTDVDGEYSVKSSILLMANRFDQDVVDIITAKRLDLIRRTEDGLKLARRKILVDHALLTQQFANLFL